jgi:hypothetical protein
VPVQHVHFVVRERIELTQDGRHCLVVTSSIHEEATGRKKNDNDQRVAKVKEKLSNVVPPRESGRILNENRQRVDIVA